MDQQNGKLYSRIDFHISSSRNSLRERIDGVGTGEWLTGDSRIKFETAAR